MTDHVSRRHGRRAGGFIAIWAATAIFPLGIAAAETAAPVPANPAVATSPPQVGTSAVVMDLSAIESVIGKSVRSVGGEDLGRIVDLLVTPAGQVRAAVIDFGGVLGVGSRKVAVDWKAIDFAMVAKDGTVRLALTRNQVRVAPEYKSDTPVVILQATPEAAKPAVATGSAEKSSRPADASSSQPPQAPKH